MNLRTRWYVLLAVAVLATFVYSRFTREWSDAAYYGGAAGLLVVLGGIGMPWIEFAPDGAFRGRPQA
jgi:hypothetical protein